MAQDRPQIVEWIKKHRKEIFGHVEPYFLKKQNIHDIIGKKYQNELSKSYLKKLDPHEIIPIGGTGHSPFKLYQHEYKKNILLFQCIRAKFVSSNEYQVVVSFEELNYWFKSLIKYDLKYNRLDLKSLSDKYDEIKQQLEKLWKQENCCDNKNGNYVDLSKVDQSYDEFLKTNDKQLKKILKSTLKLDQINSKQEDPKACNHWYRWLIANNGNIKNTKSNVSEFLHPIHNKKLELLRKRRIEQYVTKKSLILDGKDITKMKKQDLISFLCKHKFEKDMYPNADGQAEMNKAQTSVASIISKFKEKQLPILEKEYEIDHNIEKLLNEPEEIQALWAYKYGLIRLWLEKIYLPVQQEVNKGNETNQNDPIFKLAQGNLPYWSLETSRYEKTKTSLWKHEKKSILLLWNKFKQKYWLGLTFRALKFQTKEDERSNNFSTRNNLNWIKRQILTRYMANPIKYQLLYKKDDYPQSLHYMTEYFKGMEPKHWHDINFNLWHSAISRIQMGCSCRSGEQLPSFCAHCGTVLWLLYYAITPNENLKDILKRKTKDKTIRDYILNLLSHSNYQKKIEEFYKLTPNGPRGKVCTCDNVDLDEPRIRCTVCHNDFHPTCSGTTWQQLLQKGHILLQEYWKCPCCVETLSNVFDNGIDNHPTRKTRD